MGSWRDSVEQRSDEHRREIKTHGAALPLVCPWVEFVVPAGIFP